MNDHGRRPGEADEQDGKGGGLSKEARDLAGYTDATHGHRGVPADEVMGHEDAVPHEGEHDFEPDVEHLHRPIYREPRDPIEGREPVPWWVWAASAIALFWGGWYLGKHGGRFGTETHTAFPEVGTFVTQEARQETATAMADPVLAGQSVFTSRCQACHQQNGLGVPGVFPPIIGSETVVGPPEIPILIVLHGLQGPITVRGVAYNGAMPGWGAALSDPEIAAVITYIRQWESNQAPPVTPELVARLREATEERQTPWTIDELMSAIRTDRIRSAVEAATGEEPQPEGGQ